MKLPELQQNPLVQRVIDIFDTDGNGEVDFKGALRLVVVVTSTILSVSKCVVTIILHVDVLDTETIAKNINCYTFKMT